MAAENNQSDVLSSWKEIAAYLNCGIRTCMRYEEKYGLPVYRLEEKPKTHVFAYKKELDEWLQNKQNKTEGTAKKSKHNWILYFFIPLFVIALFSIYTFFIKIKLANAQPSDLKISDQIL
jgi:hypothetical protein